MFAQIIDDEGNVKKYENFILVGTRPVSADKGFVTEEIICNEGSPQELLHISRGLTHATAEVVHDMVEAVEQAAEKGAEDMQKFYDLNQQLQAELAEAKIQSIKIKSKRA